MHLVCFFMSWKLILEFAQGTLYTVGYTFDKILISTTSQLISWEIPKFRDILSNRGHFRGHLFIGDDALESGTVPENGGRLVTLCYWLVLTCVYFISVRELPMHGDHVCIMQVHVYCLHTHAYRLLCTCIDMHSSYRKSWRTVYQRPAYIGPTYDHKNLQPTSGVDLTWNPPCVNCNKMSNYSL